MRDSKSSVGVLGRARYRISWSFGGGGGGRSCDKPKKIVVGYCNKFLKKKHTEGPDDGTGIIWANFRCQPSRRVALP